ncbi:hypothetical protein D3880_16625 [Pseudomonas cavernae]|uniref:Uncharacterized protein n=1 Tax=Pseudomonas cavernae TaxID=2320867 RepID=A0A385Z7D5_9PSED|nr:hypothetical protein D3880_16625 [Pseudomonas cavernae]
MLLMMRCGELPAGISADMLDAPFMRDFLLTAKDTSFATLEGTARRAGEQYLDMDNLVAKR